jgi:hypothetical protein
MTNCDNPFSSVDISANIKGIAAKIDRTIYRQHHSSFLFANNFFYKVRKEREILTTF